MSSLQELCANWVMSDAPGRSASEAREHITWESLDNRPRHIPMWPRGTGRILMIMYSRGTCIPWNVTHVLGSGAVVPNPVSYLKVHQCQLGNGFLYNEAVICNYSCVWWEYSLRQIVDLHKEQHRSQHSSLWWAWSHRFGVWWFSFKSKSDPGHREMIGSIQGYSHRCRLFGEFQQEMIPILSNALAKSNKMVSVWGLLSRDLRKSCDSSNCVSH